MTISAQHIRAAMNHLRSIHPAWRSIIKVVGPFTMRLDRRPAWWLTQYLHCRNFWDFAEFRSDCERPNTPNAGQSSGSCETSWGEVQRQFWTELQAAQIEGTLELAAPVATRELAKTRERLNELLGRYHSTIIDRFQFYCWGGLDSWPASDTHLMDVVANFSFGASSVDTNPAATMVGFWAPYRSVAAWYLERWAESLRSDKPMD